MYFRLGLRLGVENLQYIDLDEGRPTLYAALEYSTVQYSTVYFRLGLRLGVEYPQYIDLDEGRPTVYAALGSHGLWSQPGG